MTGRILCALIVLLVGVSSAWSTPPGAGAEPRTVTIDQLKSMLEGPKKGNLIIVDVRIGSSWTRSDKKIVGAIRGDPDQIDAWASQLPRERTLVFYCS